MRLSDDWVERTGTALVREEASDSPHADLAAGRRFALNFWDANSTKALHIGHLRNLALGNALGSALAEAGGKVERRSIICDVGRSMGEAMAGVVKSGRHTQSSIEGGEKSDHFVGACYAEYVKSGPSLNGRDDNPASSLTREVDVHNDSADELLQRVLDGDQAAIELWSKTRAWVISGQRKTLARLGISFDRVFFESDFLPEVAELSNLGLEHGMLQRRPDGAVIYLTDREELEEMPLLRADGLPTQHMRALAYWMAAPGLEGTTSIQVCGLEWVAHVTCRRQLMDLMMEKGAGADINHPAHDVFHGMVSKQSESVSSSKRNALLDRRAGRVDRRGDGRGGARRGAPQPSRRRSDRAAGGARLLPHAHQHQTARLRTGEAAARGAEPRLGPGPRPRPQRQRLRAAAAEPAQDPDYRFAVVQSEMYRRHLQQAVERLDVSPLAKYVAHLSRWYVEEDREPHVQEAIQAALAQGRPRPGTGDGAMRTLLVDNHDSYTYNVFHLLAGVSGEEPIVVDNDAVSWRALERWDFDAIVLSPGPGTPGRWHDFCVCDDILRYSEIPVLGICLGHQGLGKMLDGEVRSAPEAMHGRLSKIFHEGDGLFDGIPQGFPVVRYHSLAITGMGPDGNVCAWADDGVVMGIEHRKRPMWGVQFHPESIATDHGARLVENFYELARQRKEPPVRATKRPDSARAAQHPGDQRPTPSDTRLLLRTLPGEASTEALFERLFADEEHAFWLDSADAPTRLAQCSYLGTSAGRDRCVLTYDVEEGGVRAHRAEATTRSSAARSSTCSTASSQSGRSRRPGDAAPNLLGGFVGYLGYECKADCGAIQRAQLRRPRRGADAGQPGRRRRPRPPAHPRAGGLPPMRSPRPEPGSTRRRRPCASCSPTRPRSPARPTPPSASPRRYPGQLRLRPRPRAVPRRHRPLAGRNGRRRVLRGLPHRPDLDHRRPRPLRPLPQPAPLQPGALRRLPQARRRRRGQLLA